MKIRNLLALICCLSSLFSHAQWKQCNGPYGGISRAIIFKGNDLYAASSGGGIFKSIDNAATWKPVNKGVSNPTIGSLALCGNTILAGTDGGGAFVSSDEGANWVAANNGITNMYVRAMAGNSYKAFAGTGGGVFVTTNNGTTWTNFSNGLTTQDIRALLIKDSFVFAATYGGGIFRSGISSNSWTNLTNGVTANYIYSLACKDSMIFAASGNKGVFVSGSNGDAWTVSDTSKGLQNMWVNAVTAYGNKVFAATYTGVSLSVNNGLSWTTVNNGLMFYDIRSLAYNGNLLFCGSNDWGVYKSTNNGTLWSLCGLQNTSVTSFTVFGSNVFAGAYGNYGVHLTTDLGNSFSVLPKGFHYHQVNALTHVDSVLFAGIDGDGIYVSKDFGKNWVARDSGFNNPFFYCYSFLTQGTSVYAGTNVGVYSSSNLGLTWDSLCNGLPAYKGALSLAYTGNKLYAGTKGAGIYIYNSSTGVWASSNTGLTGLNVYSICVNGASLFAGTDNGLFVSVNGGTSWTAVTNGIQYVYIYALTATGNYMFAGTNAGTYFSADAGVTWKYSVTGIDGLATKDTRALAISGNTVFAGMHDGAAWTRSISDFTEVNEVNHIAKNAVVAYPNPFSGEVHFDLMNRSRFNQITIVMYDVNGNEVARGCFGSNDPLILHKEGLKEGSYVYRILSHEEVVATGKLLFRNP